MSNNPEHGLVANNILGLSDSKCRVGGVRAINRVWNQVLRHGSEVSWGDLEEVGLELQFAIFLTVDASGL